MDSGPRHPPCFHVSVHDVAPVHGDTVRGLLGPLTRRLGDRLSLAVVPAWHGLALDARRDRALLDAIRGSGAEVLQHGVTHRAARLVGALGLLTGRCNELAALDRGEALAQLGRGRDWLGEALGRAPSGLVPPAWAPGPVDDAMLRELGLACLITLAEARSPAGDRRRLATRSWDTDRAGWLAPLGEALGAAAAWRWPGAVEHVVIHPLDVTRGWLPRALGRIDALLARGLAPARWDALLAPVVASAVSPR